ncbi:hypothetical protein [Clostridium perfringens]|uniref:hypothetical protein n=1 Tax=Clostridium perfringens TaxID=1502 RepID=UPI0039ECE578
MNRVVKDNEGVDYRLVHEWKNWTIHCSNTGIVFNSKGDCYETAFFEVYPKDPDTFIRGQGKTINEAEEEAWKQYEKIINCHKHEFERRGYENGLGFCKHCGLLKSKAFKPSHNCVICNKATYYKTDKNGNYYCKNHADLIPLDDMRSYEKTRYLLKKAKTIVDVKSLNNAISYINKEIRPFYQEYDVCKFISFIELLYKKLSKQLEKEDISSKYIVTYESSFMIFHMNFSNYKFNSLYTLKDNNGEEYIILVFDEFEDMCEDDDKIEYKETGRLIHLVYLNQNGVDDIIKMYK